jgi:hypothetical protein
VSHVSSALSGDVDSSTGLDGRIVSTKKYGIACVACTAIIIHSCHRLNLLSEPSVVLLMSRHSAKSGYRIHGSSARLPSEVSCECGQVFTPLSTPMQNW